MAKSQVYRRGQADVRFNMTPMIDCTFQLIIFFILTTQIASQEYARIDLPEPDRSVAKEYQLNKAVVNVLAYPQEMIEKNASLLGAAMEYRLGMARVRKGRVDKVIRELIRLRREREARAGSPEGVERAGPFVVELRADKSVHYTEIEPILHALQEANLGRMYITAERG